MPHRKIGFVKNYYYHIFNRGSRKQDIFLSSKDYTRFLKKIEKNKEKYHVSILVYCLMSNHFHFILKQNSNILLSSFIQSLCNSHSKYFNIKNELVGPLFQGPFKAKLIESEEYLLQLSKYIHLNPTEIVSFKKSPAKYPYSSYSEYLKKTGLGLCETELILSYFSKTNPRLSYRSFIEERETDFENISNLLLD